MTDRRPWLKWYPADWRADEKLRMCSFAARGLWVDLLGLMHVAEPYGHLLVNGVAPTSAQLANLLGGSEREIKRLLAELSAAGVCSSADGGILYSRRMVRDKAKFDRDRANGKGGGNPSLMPTAPEGVNPQANPPVGDGDKAHMPDARKLDTSSLRSDAAPAPPSKPAAEPSFDLERDMPEGLRRSRRAPEEAARSQAIWRDGLAYVVSATGKPEAKARELVGRWCAEFGNRAVHDVLRSAAALTGPDALVSPVAWIEKALRSGGSNGKRGQHPSGFNQPFMAAHAEGTGDDRGT